MDNDNKVITLGNLKTYTKQLLPKANTTEFTPTGDYNPATKKYVDDALAAIPAVDTSNLIKSVSWNKDTGRLTVTKNNETDVPVISDIKGDLGISDLDDRITDLETASADFITNTVDNLTNYYKKDETFTKTEVNTLISAISQMKVEKVAILPEIGDTTKIYLVPKVGTPAEGNIYEEYIWVENKYELIGDTEIDLSGYVTSDALATALADYVKSADLTTTLADYVTNTALTTALADYVKSADLATTLDDYVKADDLDTTLADYSTTTEMNTAIATAKGEATDYTDAEIAKLTFVKTINGEAPDTDGNIDIELEYATDADIEALFN